MRKDSDPDTAVQLHSESHPSLYKLFCIETHYERRDTDHALARNWVLLGVDHCLSVMSTTAPCPCQQH